MTLKNAGHILMEEIRDAIDCLKLCVTPIFYSNEKREPGLLGSAVLVRVKDEVFLCTAKHVIDGNVNSTLYVGCSELEPLLGDFYSSKDHDVAVLKLSPSQIQTLSKFNPHEEDRIGNKVQISNCRYAEFMGFPESKNRVLYKKTKNNGLIYSNGGIVKKITCTQVHVIFDQNRNIDANTGQRVNAPDPHGMSGGAMFGVQMNGEIIQGRPNPLLIGISTYWDSKSKEVFGTNFAIVMAIIRDAYNITLSKRLNPTNITTNLSVAKVSPPTQST